MTEPCRVIPLKHAQVELWDWGCVTVFVDGACVPAAPNGSDTVLDTLAHEWAHSALAEVLHDRPSVCLRGVVEGHGKQWTPEKHEEETLAYALGLRLADLLKAVAGNGAQAVG